MTRYIQAAVIVVGIFVSAQAQAQVTATCKDGTSWSGSNHRGACSHHGGATSFSDAAVAPPADATPAPAPAPATTPPSTAVAPVPAAPTAAAGPSMSCPGDKVVWVNIPTHIYHFQGERYFGKTASGKYMCERAADAEGDHPTKNGQ